MLHNDQAGCHADDSLLHGLDAGIVINRTDLDDFASVFKGAVQDVQDLLSRPPVVAGVTHHALYCHLSAESCTAHSSHAWLSFTPPPHSPHGREFYLMLSFPCKSGQKNSWQVDNSVTVQRIQATFLLVYADSILKACLLVTSPYIPAQ